MTGSRRKGLVLQTRDRHLLRELATMRVIDREQAKLVADFRSTTRANARLLALTRAGLLRRFFAGTIFGGRKAIYSLTAKGAASVNVPLIGLQRKQNEMLIGDLFVEHQMWINSIFATVKYRPIPVPSVSFRLWGSPRERLSKVCPIIPDGYFELATPQGFRSAFLEVDLGTEALRVWRKKIQAYLQLAISGEFGRVFGQAQFRVLVVTASGRRLETIRRTTARLTDKIFWFSTFEFINRDGFWSAIWLRPHGDQRQSLL